MNDGDLPVGAVDGAQKRQNDCMVAAEGDETRVMLPVLRGCVRTVEHGGNIL
jgi:hypothetical protein